MKNFTLMLLAAASVFSVSAQTKLPANPAYTPVEVAIVNPTFDTGLSGWTTEGPSAALWGVKNGRARCIETLASVEPGTLLLQTVEGPGAGAYLLKADVIASRNGNRGNINTLKNIFESLILADQNDDFRTNVESKGYSKIGETGGTLTENFHIFETSLDAPILTLGYGHSAFANGNPKGCLECDNFKLYYFPNCTTDQVNEWLQNDGAIAGVADVEAAPVGDNKFYNLMGVEVAEPTAAGIYIHNGKKFIVR